jgi:glycosyltransferase involved in cell wall biosynthesis
LIDLDFPKFTYLINENATCHRPVWLWTKITADHLLSMARPLLRLRRPLRDTAVDIVVSNTVTVTLGALVAKLLRKPHVWCIKECLDPSLPACRRFAKLISRLSSAVVVPSRAAASAFPSGVRICRDGNNIDAIRLSAGRSSREKVLGELDLPPGRPVVAQIGAMTWLKGQHVTTEALLRTAASNQNPSFSLLFLGRGNSEYCEKIERALASAPPQWRDAVRFLSFDPGDFSCLAAADIVVHPSVLPDTFPNAVREAMILGKPVIASRGGGIVDMIRDGETGVLFEPGNSGELAAAIARLTESTTERKRVGEAAQDFARSQFDITLRKHEFSALLRSLVLEPAV